MPDGEGRGEAVGPRLDQPAAIPQQGRMSTVTRLAGELASLAAAGDLEGVRLVQETIARLVALDPVAGGGSSRAAPPGVAAVVVDLEAERTRRSRR